MIELEKVFHESHVCVSGDRLAGASTALSPAWSHRPDTSDAGLQGILQRSLHLHDWQQSQECALLRQVHRLLPDADECETGECVDRVTDDNETGEWVDRVTDDSETGEWVDRVTDDSETGE